MARLSDRADPTAIDAGAWLDRPAAAACVAQRYRGVWRRTLLRNAQQHEDRTTRVFWLQTARVHVDLRVSADRRGLDGAGGLDALPRDLLVELARQQGFAGYTAIEPGAPDVCTWHRQIDFSPPTGARDIGTMRFESPHVLLEDGVDACYHERWAREPASTGPTWAMRVTRCAPPAAGSLRDANEAPASRDEPVRFLARAGGFFMFARARSAEAAAWLAQHPGRTLAQIAGDPSVSLEQVRAMLDFEISLARVAASPGAPPVIALSTHPWREGCTLCVPPDPAVETAASLDSLTPRSHDVDD